MDLSVDLDEIDYLKLSSSYLLKVEKERSGQYVIEPYRFYLAPTFEKVGLPTASKIAARVEGRSTLGRLGLVVHMTAPTIHSGYGATKNKGPGIITLEIFNYGPFKICVTPGKTYICQLIFESVKTVPSQRKTTKTFTGQQTPKG